LRVELSGAAHSARAALLEVRNLIALLVAPFYNGPSMHDNGGVSVGVAKVGGKSRERL